MSKLLEAWLAAASDRAHSTPQAHTDELPVIDAGMREWYTSCRCCVHDAYPKIVEQLDVERAAIAAAPSEAGICEIAEAEPRHS